MGRLNHYKKKLPPLRISSRAATVWKHCSSSTTHIDRRTLPTHSVSFFLSYRLSSLWDAAVVSPPDPPVETLGNLHPPPPHCRTLTLPHANIYIQYILLPPPTCFSVPTPPTPVTVTLSAQCISTKLVLSVSCIYHWMPVYILCTSTKCRLCTTPVVSLPLLPHNPPPSPLP